MASIASVRTSLETWLEQRVRIDAWDLDVPANVPTVLATDTGDRRFPANCALSLPVREWTMRKDGEGVLYGIGTFTYAIVYRFNGKAAKAQLPMKEVELLLNYLTERATLYPREINGDISDVEVLETADPVTLGRIEGEDGDWLIIARFEMRLKFFSTADEEVGDLVLQPPGTVPPDPVFELKEIQAGIYRNLAPQVTPDNPARFVLDALLEIRE